LKRIKKVNKAVVKQERVLFKINLTLMTGFDPFQMLTMCIHSHGSRWRMEYQKCSITSMSITS